MGLSNAPLLKSANRPPKSPQPNDDWVHVDRDKDFVFVNGGEIPSETGYFGQIANTLKERATEFYTTVRNTTDHIALVGFGGIGGKPNCLTLINPHASKNIPHVGHTLEVYLVQKILPDYTESITLSGYSKVAIGLNNTTITITPSNNVNSIFHLSSQGAQCSALA